MPPARPRRRPGPGESGIILYGPRAAPVVEKVARALALKRLAFELHEPRSPQDYRHWSPETGLLPVIEIDGERVYDSTAILLRLDELFPEPPLLSADPRTAAAQHRLANWVDESFFWYWMRWQRIRPEGPPDETPASGLVFGKSSGDARLPEPPRPAGVSLRDWLGRRLRRDPEPAQPESTRLVYEIGHRVDDTARLLGGRRFFYADRISMADLAVYGMLRSLREDSIPGTAAQLARHPQLGRFMERIEEATGGIGPAAGSPSTS